MAIDTVLIQLADLVAKIENIRALLDGRHETLTDDDRAHVNALLGRLNAKRAQLENELREMAEKKGQ